MSGAEPPARPARVIGEGLSSHRNSLNFLRLVLASVVVVSHAAGLAHFHRVEGIVNGTSPAELALYGFFAISGYLIAQSAMRTRPLGYLWRRCLRIFPGLIACLVVTAFGIGLVAWWWTSKPGCGLGCYLSAPDSPFSYVAKNSLLANPYWNQATIAGLPHFGLFPDSWTWNASIWTLFYEFLCYLLILGLSIAGMLRHRLAALASLAVVWAAVITITCTHRLSVQFNFLHFSVWESLLRFTLIFLTGTVLYVYRDKVPDSGWLALGSTIALVIGIILPTGGRFPTFQFTPIDLFLPFVAYPVLWLGLHLPFRRVGATNDYSYGIYIYGWPLTQLLIMWHVRRFGWFVFVPASVGITLPFAMASWWLVERRALRLKSLDLRRSRATTSEEHHHGQGSDQH